MGRDLHEFHSCFLKSVVLFHGTKAHPHYLETEVLPMKIAGSEGLGPSLNFTVEDSGLELER